MTLTMFTLATDDVTLVRTMRTHSLTHSHSTSVWVHDSRGLLNQLGESSCSRFQLGDDITPEVKQVLDGEIYLEWPEGVRNQKWVDHFFDRLVGGIRGEQICGGCQCFKPTSWRYARTELPYDDQVSMTSIPQDR